MRKRISRLLAVLLLWFVGIVYKCMAVVLSLTVVGSVLLAHQGSATAKSLGITSGLEKNVRYGGENYEYDSSIRTFYVMGIDKLSKVVDNDNGLAGGQSDANFLVVVSSKRKTIQVIQVNRSCMTDVQTYDYYGNKDARVTAQLALAHAYGGDATVNALNAVRSMSGLFYGLDINGYMAVNMGAIKEFNYLVGCVTVQSLETFSAEGRDFVEGETYELDGLGSYLYLHYRDLERFNSNESRAKRQQQYLGLFKTALMDTVRKNPAALLDMYDAAGGYITTNLGAVELLSCMVRYGGYDFMPDGMLEVPGTTTQGQVFEEFNVDEDEFRKLVMDIFYIQK
jgi:anionic cell wall polymer biosynthesis LytR-Cps2A-Psr (LCP) family protein